MKLFPKYFDQKFYKYEKDNIQRRKYRNRFNSIFLFLFLLYCQEDSASKMVVVWVYHKEKLKGKLFSSKHEYMNANKRIKLLLVEWSKKLIIFQTFLQFGAGKKSMKYTRGKSY